MAVTVTPVNDNPIAVGDFATTTTGTPVVVDVVAPVMVGAAAIVATVAKKRQT